MDVSDQLLWPPVQANQYLVAHLRAEVCVSVGEVAMDGAWTRHSNEWNREGTVMSVLFYSLF
jgi:hypothetical protein